MKHIIDNRYLRTFKFSNYEEAAAFVKNQKTKKSLYIKNTFGDNYYCYICYHSLTDEIQFVLLFSSDESEGNLNFLYWKHLFVLDNAKNIFLIDENLSIKSSIEITTPLIGLYVIKSENLLILEEAFMRVVNYKGEIIKSELFDLIENFSINDNSLSLQTSDESKVIKLS